VSPHPHSSPKWEKGDTLQSKLQHTARDYYRHAADAHFFNLPGCAFDFQPDATGPIDEIALLDHELVNVIDRVDTRRIVINQISAERAGRTSRGRIFANVHAHKETRIRPPLPYFDRLARERVTSRTATKDLTALEDFIEQSLIHATIAEVSERTHRNQEHCVAGRHSLNRQSLIQIVSR